MVAHNEAYSPRCSSTIRTGRFTSLGVSDALASKLKVLEDERDKWQEASIQAGANHQMPDLPNLRALYKRILLRLNEFMQSDVAKARPILAGILGDIRLEQDGEEVWAEMNTAQSLMTIEPYMNMVAGTGFEPMTFGL